LGDCHLNLLELGAAFAGVEDRPFGRRDADAVDGSDVLGGDRDRSRVDDSAELPSVGERSLGTWNRQVNDVRHYVTEAPQNKRARVRNERDVFADREPSSDDFTAGGLGVVSKPIDPAVDSLKCASVDVVTQSWTSIASPRGLVRGEMTVLLARDIEECLTIWTRGAHVFD